MSGAKQES